MSWKNSITQWKQTIRRLNGCTIMYNCSSYLPMVGKINAHADTLKNVSDDTLKGLSQKLKIKAQSGVPIDSLLVESFALVKETVCRVLKLSAFNEQIIGALVLHEGKIAEMQTGEGKTLTAVFPAFLNALTGKGVHVLTFNDYLAARDARWMGPVYAFLGLRVGHVREGMGIKERREGYGADVTYVTAKESGFDYLRDSLRYAPEDIVHRSFHYAIIDEADSILIDEARIPLVIAGASESTGRQIDAEAWTLYALALLARELRDHEDFEFDAYARNIFLTDTGLKRVEGLLKCDNLYAPENGQLLGRLHFALHAEYLLKQDRDYIVRKGGVELIDECTGRVADKRKWPDGLQAAVEAKEKCAVKQKGVILNSITLQHFIRRYSKLCGMTATAQIAEEEFREFYNLSIAVVAPHKPCMRTVFPDIIYKSIQEKYGAIVREIIREHAAGRPILVGTHTIRESELIAGLLKQNGLHCNILNAKRDALEANIIAQAGKTGAITISTNMAGRGTDIRLGGADETDRERVISRGGLYVLGTTRFESRRIDDQLKGRGARQGDPGIARCIISLDDPLCKKYKLHELVPPRVWKNADSVTIDNPLVYLELDRLQRIIEGQHLEIKKTLYKYSLLIEQQRAILFEKRQKILQGEDGRNFFFKHSPDALNAMIAAFGQQKTLTLCKRLLLSSIDKAWSLYLSEMNEIRECIHLRVYGKQDPHFEYNKCAIELFDHALRSIDSESLSRFNQVASNNAVVDEPGDTFKAPAATWTYLVNDNPFEDRFSRDLAANPGLSLWAGFLWPLLALYYALAKLKKSPADKSVP